MIYNLESIIEEGKYKGQKVADIITEDKKAVWQMIVKEHLQFADDVLSAVNIKKKVSDVHVESVVVEHKRQKPLAKKDTKKEADDVMRELEVIEKNVINAVTDEELERTEEETPIE